METSPGFFKDNELFDPAADVLYLGPFLAQPFFGYRLLGAKFRRKYRDAEFLKHNAVFT